MKKSLKTLFTSIGLVLLVFQMPAQPINFDWVRRFIPSIQFLKTAFLFAFFCVCCGIQAQDFVYAKGLGGTDYDLGRSIATDASGNAYVTGYFRGTVDFDPSANTANLSSSGSASDVFLAKYNSYGDYVYAIRFGGGNADESYSVTVDSIGNTYVIGDFYGTVDFDPSAQTANLTSSGQSDIFLAKYDPLGNYLNAINLGGNSFDKGRSVTIDGSGNVYITGSFAGTADFDPSSNTAFLSSHNGNYDIFLAKYDASLNYIYAFNLVGTSNEGGWAVAVDDSDNVYIVGDMLGSVDFDPSIDTALRTPNGFGDMFLAKYDALGNYVYAVALNGHNTDAVFAVAVDGYGSAYITGRFSGIVDFDPSSSAAFLVSSNNSDDIFLAKYNASGDYEFAFKLGHPTSSADDVGRSVAVDDNNNVYLTGTFKASLDFDPSGDTAMLNSNDGIIFIASYDSYGNYISAVNVGSYSDNEAFSMSLDNMDNLYITGYLGRFSASADFDPSPNTSILTTNGFNDIFIAKYNLGCSVSNVLLEDSICMGDSLFVGGAFQRTSGIYMDTLKSARGCDSILTTSLTVNLPDTTLVQTTTADSSLAGVFDTTFTNQAGCDSVVITTVVYQAGPCAKIDTVTTIAASCDSSLAGTITQVLTGSDGCDSIFISIITFDLGSLTLLGDKEICQGDSMLIFGNYQNSAGTYQLILQNKNGCDSILECTLIVKPVYFLTVMDSICPGDSLFVGGGWQSAAGTYTDVYRAANNCDSTVTTQLLLRSDSGCVVDTSSQNCLTVVSDNTWMKSTVVDPSNLSGFWAGAPSLPGAGTFTNAVTIGQPYGYPSIGQIQNSEVISTGSDITYFRKEFLLTNTTSLDVRVLTAVDDQADIYLNGQRVAFITQFGTANFKFPAHDVKFESNGTTHNGFLGGDAFDVVTPANLNGFLTTGTNEVIVAVRNLGKPGNRGGFSFRMDINCDDNAITKKVANVYGGELSGLVVYPNPVKELLNIDSELAINSVRLFDLTGKLVLQTAYSAEKVVELNLGNFNAGLYLLEVEEVGGSVSTMKIVKN